MALTVKFIGALRHITGQPKLSFNFAQNFSIKDLILQLTVDKPQLKANLISQQTDGTLKTNALILVNDREISVLSGLNTQLQDGDEIVFIPVVHGG
jgi:molybdopterin synthase sulfur carrier subunit